MEFKKEIYVPNHQTVYYLSKPITVNDDDRFVKVEYWYPHPNKDDKELREIIINCNIIESGK